jgi:hypothetical protein
MVGRKTKDWQRAKRKLVKEALLEGRFVLKENRPYGYCVDCSHTHYLTPDHKIKRSQGGGHTKENIDWVCNEFPCLCHTKRDNLGDPMNKKPKSKKANWAKEHPCIKCKKITFLLYCNHCGQLSVAP